ncbi:hypothetical protein Pfo_028105 [Paulownia fortunei]|nr:hypothetical protein Pfo_028105 [Paulownia fortunei]
MTASSIARGARRPTINEAYLPSAKSQVRAKERETRVVQSFRSHSLAEWIKSQLSWLRAAKFFSIRQDRQNASAYGYHYLDIIAAQLRVGDKLFGTNGSIRGISLLKDRSNTYTLRGPPFETFVFTALRVRSTSSPRHQGSTRTIDLKALERGNEFRDTLNKKSSTCRLWQSSGRGCSCVRGTELHKTHGGPKNAHSCGDLVRWELILAANLAEEASHGPCHAYLDVLSPSSLSRDPFDEKNTKQKKKPACLIVFECSGAQTHLLPKVTGLLFVPPSSLEMSSLISRPPTGRYVSS